MKITKHILTAVLLTGLAAGTMSACADDKPKDTKVKAYPLTICVVTDEKLGEHGKPYVFTHEGQEIKLCCKDCLKDFKADPAKYLKKIEDAQKKEKK